MGGLIGGAKVDTPSPRPPARMPDDQSPQVLDAKRRKEEDILTRGGRASTILTVPASPAAAASGMPAPYSATRSGSGA